MLLASLRSSDDVMIRYISACCLGLMMMDERCEQRLAGPEGRNGRSHCRGEAVAEPADIRGLIEGPPAAAACGPNLRHQEGLDDHHGQVAPAEEVPELRAG